MKKGNWNLRLPLEIFKKKLRMKIWNMVFLITNHSEETTKQASRFFEIRQILVAYVFTIFWFLSLLKYLSCSFSGKLKNSDLKSEGRKRHHGCISLKVQATTKAHSRVAVS